MKSSVPFERWNGGRASCRQGSVVRLCRMRHERERGRRFQAGIPLSGRRIMPTVSLSRRKCWSSATRTLSTARWPFPWHATTCRSSFAGNAQELDRLKEFLSENLNIEGTELKEVNIKGYASPEGDFDYNKSLAQRRTQTLSEYISSQYPALKKAPVYRTEGVGEDWEGLKAAVSGSTLANKEEILFIIGHNGSDTEREAAIRALDDGRSYQVLLKEFYPSLRRTTFSLSFDVRPYTMEELPGIF